MTSYLRKLGYDAEGGCVLLVKTGIEIARRINLIWFSNGKYLLLRGIWLGIDGNEWNKEKISPDVQFLFI